MSMLQIEYHDDTVIIKLNRGVTQALNQAFIDELIEFLQRIRQSPDVRSLVLTSANEKFFCIGLDIPGLLEFSVEGFDVFYRSFNRLCLELYTFPKPTVAAINGHTIAGGCILTLCCDYRFMSSGRKWIGLNEIKLGVPVPYPADCILRDLLGSRLARDIMNTGDFFTPEQALEIGLIDRILPPEQVVSASIEKAKLLGAFIPSAFAAIKRNRIEPVETEVLSHMEEQVRLFVECWYSPEARQRFKEAMEKF
jgi:enoyl-CoA hydratase/carnithine racemase